MKFRSSQYKLRLVLSDRKGNPYWEVLDSLSKIVYIHKEKSWAVQWVIDQDFWGRVQVAA